MPVKDIYILQCAYCIVYHPYSSPRRSPQHQYSQETPIVTSQEKNENETKRQKRRQRSSKILESQLNPPDVNVGCSSVSESKPHIKDTTPKEECAVVLTSDKGKPSAMPPSPKKVWMCMSSARLHSVNTERKGYKTHVIRQSVWHVFSWWSWRQLLWPVCLTEITDFEHAFLDFISWI